MRMMQNQIFDYLFFEMLEQYKPIVSKVSFTLDDQDSQSFAASDLDTQLSLKFAAFNSAFYVFIGSNLIVFIFFVLIRKFYPRKNESQKLI